ncbi:C2H2 type zinc-finger-domain-containing protein [Auriculariales sp. MPI-PUGE-AT-0066]|nr:C2H2 type zinc-finger-domain-containing protein [Auriculariales sp. MPI-PUGE-AT-0066]
MATAVASAPNAVMVETGQLFTCISCSIAFHTGEEQRGHYRSDHHRYNMKRRVAGLSPLSADQFNEKVLERRAQTSLTVSAKSMTCDICRKVYTTENAYRSHLNSKRHKENEAKPASARPAPSEQSEASNSSQPPAPPLAVPADADEETINATIDARIAAARSQLAPTACLYCPQTSASVSKNLDHMHTAHGFFVPDAEYLVDVTGLLAFLAGKVAVAHACIFCAREFRTLDAVRKHMVDKSHAKVPYKTERDRLDISDFYDFRSKEQRREERRVKRAAAKLAAQNKEVDEEEWEDEDDDGEAADEVVDVEDPPASESESDTESDELPMNQLTYGDSPFELVLPTGERLGHRSLSRYYKQRFSPLPAPASADPNSGASLVRKLLTDKNSALVPHGVVKARNKGEARNAGRHVREFRDQRRREEFRTRIGFIGNHQKHYRDPLLQ